MMNRIVIIIIILFSFFNLNAQVSCAEFENRVTYTPNSYPPICIGTYTFKALTSPHIANVTFSWKYNNIIDNDSTVIYEALQPGIDTLFIIANYPGCPTFTKEIPFFTIRSNAEWNNSVRYITSSSTLPVCIGDTRVYGVGSVISISGFVYQWKDKNGVVISNNSLDLTITHSGSDLYVLESIYPRCPIFKDTLSFYIKENLETALNLGPDQTFCEGESTILNAAVTDAQTYLWNTGATTSSIVASENLNYWVKVSNICNFGRDTLKITLKPLPKVNLGGSREECYGKPILLDAVTTNCTYLWNTGAVTQTISVDERNIMISVLVDSSGCKGGDTITISDCPVDSQLPNAFTPNNDGNNDVLKVHGNNISEIDLKIFNRLGIMIYNGNDINSGWDGTYKGVVQESDVYVYILKTTLNDGTTTEKSGSILLMR